MENFSSNMSVIGVALAMTAIAIALIILYMKKRFTCE
jgi:hypothetical protein